jgi:hypothetical protein
MLVISILVVLALVLGLVIAFHRVTTRTRRELGQAQQRHAAALEQLVARGVAAWDAEPGPDRWSTVSGTRDGLDFTLAVVGDLSPSTKFIGYSTQLIVSCPGGPAEPLRLAPPDAEQLAQLGVPGELGDQLARSCRALVRGADRLLLGARPSEPTLLRYSYGLHLNVDPEALETLIASGLALARALRGPRGG